MDIVQEFLGDPTSDQQPERETTRGTEALAFRTVLFTDLVGHTEMMSRLGDEAGREVLREHERITPEVLKEHGGTEVKTMGDGFMASFGSVTKAVECAVALQTAIEERNRSVGAQQPPDDLRDPDHHHEVAAPLRVRIGLNAGEPIEEDGDLFGATVTPRASRRRRRVGRYWWRILFADCAPARGFCSRTAGSSWPRGSRSRCGCTR